MYWDPLRILEVVAAAMIFGAGVWLYRRPKGEESDGESGGYGSQGAVLLIVIAAIVAIHGLGGLEYRPSASELEMYEGLQGMSH